MLVLLRVAGALKGVRICVMGCRGFNYSTLLYPSQRAPSLFSGEMYSKNTHHSGIHDLLGSHVTQSVNR